MTRTLQEKLEIMQAKLDGKTIEIHNAYGWNETQSPVWNWADFDYRVKQEPTKLYAFVEFRGRVVHKTNTDSPGAAFKRAKQFDITFEE
jgi:hypothetical protein